MTFLRDVCRSLLLIGLLASMPVSAAQQQPQQPPKQLDEFVPIENLPPTEQIPAARLVVAAYSFVWVALFFYVVSVARRLGTVQREVERLETDLKQGKRP